MAVAAMDSVVPRVVRMADGDRLLDCVTLRRVCSRVHAIDDDRRCQCTHQDEAPDAQQECESAGKHLCHRNICVNVISRNACVISTAARYLMTSARSVVLAPA